MNTYYLALLDFSDNGVFRIIGLYSTASGAREACEAERLWDDDSEWRATSSGGFYATVKEDAPQFFVHALQVDSFSAPKGIGRAATVDRGSARSNIQAGLGCR